jgi:N-acylneuraminate cytidylyltransferase/CMP-N,N'-diacetyllegionaminic acid synthase
MTTVAVLCARGGSKAVAGKNIKMLAGRPLIYWTIEQARKSQLFDYVVVSSDAPDILLAAEKAGATYLVKRPKALATDAISVLPAVEHALASLEADRKLKIVSFVLLQPTSPTREVDDITGAMSLFESAKCSSVITGIRARSSPYFSIVEKKLDGSVVLCKTLSPPISRRQDAPECFDMNGSIYVVNRTCFYQNQKMIWPDTQLYEMVEENSVDIDTPLDFKIANMIMIERQRLKC